MTRPVGAGLPAATLAEALWNRPARTVAVVLAGLALGLALPSLQVGTPEATLVLALDAQDRTQDDELDDAVRAGRLLRSPEVLDTVTSAVRRPAPTTSRADVDQDLVAVPDQDGTSVEVRYRHPDVRAARVGLSAAVNAVDRVRGERRQALAAARLAQLDQVDALLRQSGTPLDGGAARQLGELRAELLLLQQDPGGTLLRGRVKVDDGRSVHTKLALVVGPVAGLFVALLLGHRAAVGRPVVTRLRTAGRALGAPVLSVVPAFARDRRGRPRQRRDSAQAYRVVAGVLASRGPARLVVLDGDGGGADSASVATGIATALAEAGQQVTVLAPGSLSARDRPPPSRWPRRRSVLGASDGSPLPTLGGDLVLLAPPTGISTGRGLEVARSAQAAIVAVRRGAVLDDIVRTSTRLQSLGLPCEGVVVLMPRGLGLRPSLPVRRIRLRSRLRPPSAPVGVAS